jgi:cytochrome c biogenesis protein CcdA
MMQKKLLRIGTYILLFPWALLGMGSVAFLSHAQEGVVSPVLGEEIQHVSESDVSVYFFGREDCHFCQLEKVFFDNELPKMQDVDLVYYDIVESQEAKDLFVLIAEANSLAQVTPLTLVGGRVIQGYNSDQTTGAAILAGIEQARAGNNFDVGAYLNPSEVLKSGSGCDMEGDSQTCAVEVADTSGLALDLPFVGVIHPEDYSLLTLAAVLGTIDGFNPCALWVLMTFLLILMQIGDRKKMFYVAGLFLLAEAVMYYLILTVWYKTWDFVGLDQIVTPLVGLLAVGSGVYFLYKWYKSRDQLVCDVTSLDQQASIQGKIQKLVTSPMTLATVAGIVGIALSVNIIEFACSIGIPQVFTKVLELNGVSFWTQQWYTFIYIIGYMVDDLVVFAFALYGIDKMHASEKYSKLSMLIGGVLMLLLGLLLIAFPNALVF